MSVNINSTIKNDVRKIAAFSFRDGRFPLSFKPAFPMNKKVNTNIRNLAFCFDLTTSRKSVNVCKSNNVNDFSVNIRNVPFVIVFTTNTDNNCTGNAVNGPRSENVQNLEKQNKTVDVNAVYICEHDQYNINVNLCNQKT